MMPEVQLTDFQGVSATFTLGRPLTLISGPNGAGKSRIARAVAGVLASEPAPITGKRGDGRECLTDGEGRASAVVRSGDSFRAMIWSGGKGEPSIKGPQDDLPRATKYAAGLVNVLSLTGKDRAAAFAEVFRTEPAKSELAAAFKKAGLPLSYFDSLWDLLTINGWDAIADEASKKARALKARWNEVTGATWGERVAETWQPDAKHFPDPAELKAELQRTKENLENARQVLEAAKAERTKLPERVDDDTSHACPWDGCGRPVKFEFGRLVKVEGDAATKRSRQQIKELRMAIAGADGEIAHAQDQVYHQERAVGAAEARLADAAVAREKAIERAAELHAEIMQELEIAKICGPAGLRQQKLEEVVGEINRSLASLSRKGGLPVLKIDAELDATLGGTPYHRLSRAESWLARTIMQIEVARRQQSTWIVVDDLDVLASPQDRNGILAAIYGSGLSALVLQASWDPADTGRTPDLEAAGAGLTYWIDRKNGLRPIAAVRAEHSKEAA